MSVIEVNDRNFIPEVQCSEVPVLLDFFGTWCVPCQRFAPTVEELAAESEGRYKVCKVDVNAAPGLVQQFRIMSVPTVLIVSEGREALRLVGGQDKAPVSYTHLTLPTICSV